LFRYNVTKDESGTNDYHLAGRKIVEYAPPVEMFWVCHCHL